jgi:hypothetical protein
MKKEVIEQYRKKQIADITLPSGLIVEVRNISPYAILKAQEEMGIGAGELDEISASLVEKLFKGFLVSPKVPDEFTVGDFNKEDYEKLQDLVLEHVIYTEEKKEIKK